MCHISCWLVLLLVLWFCLPIAVAGEVVHKYISRQGGKDTNTCGTEQHPCKTLYKALNTTSSAVYLHIDGSATQQDPYKCENLGYIAFESTTFESIKEDAHISCLAGALSFLQSSLSSSITLSKLVLIDTTLEINNGHLISLLNCKLLNNTQSTAAMIVDTSNGITEVSIQDTVFQNITKSCLVVSTSLFRFHNVLNLSIVNTRFVENGMTSQNGIMASAIDISQGLYTNLECRNVTFTQNKGSFINIFRSETHPQSTVEVDIRGSLFERNHAMHSSSYWPMYIVNIGSRFSDRDLLANLTITDTILVSNDNGVKLSDATNAIFENVTINMTRNAVFLTSGRTNKSPVRVIIRHCYFGHNTESLYIGMYMYTGREMSVTNRNVTVFIQDTIFQGNHPSQDSATAFRIVSLQNDNYSLRKLKSYIFLERVKVFKIHGKAMSLDLQTFKDNLILVKSSVFANVKNTNDAKEKGPIIHVNLPIVEAKSRIIYMTSTFENNTGFASVILIKEANVTFVNCKFKDNFATDHGGTIRVVQGTGGLHIYNTTALVTDRQFEFKGLTEKMTRMVYFYRGSSLVIRNSSFIVDDSRDSFSIFSIIKEGNVSYDRLSSVQCPVGYYLSMNRLEQTEHIQKGGESYNTNITSQTFYCQRCGEGFYSLERGHSEGLTLMKTSSCLPCPYGANCFQNIMSKTNFWGYVASEHPPTLKFLPCPHEYCQRTRNAKTSSYNSCYGNRSGVLCGRCARGYTEELFETKCKERSKCRDGWFWPLTILYTTVMALYFVFKPPFISFLYRNIFWFEKSDTAPEADHDIHHNSGYTKVVFYFYQVAELVLTNSCSDLIQRVVFISPMVALFSFQFRLMSGSFGCPFSGLTVVTKELLFSLKVITVISCLLPIYAVHQVVNRLRHRDQPPLTTYLAVIIEILLVGYERLAETSLKLLRCVEIGNESRLFWDGNIQCWQWWQHMFIAYVAVFVVRFFLVLYWGSLKLYTNSISDKEFLCSCIIPLPYLVYWAVKHYKKILTIVPKENITEVKQVLHNPFRPPSDEHPGTLHWESVLIGRRFVLLCVYTFITDPMIRQLCMDCACVAIFIHHLIKRPYRDTKVNFCESVSLLALVFLSTISALKAAFISAGIEPIGPNEKHFTILQWIEIVILGFLPTAFFIMVSCALLSQAIRLILLAAKMCSLLVAVVSDSTREFRLRYLQYRGHYVLESVCSDEETIYEE